jgi:hypothetical protein
MLNIWGTFSPYIGSYYHSLDPETTRSSLVKIPLIGMVFENLSMLVLPILVQYMSLVNIITSTLVLFSLSLFLLSYTHSALLFSICFGTLIGTESGIISLGCIWIGIETMPEIKGFVMGIGLCGYAMAPTIYGIIFTMCVNPDNIYPDENNQNYFNAEVTSRVPTSIKILAIIFLIIGLLSSFFMNIKSDIKVDSGSKSTFTLKEVLKHSKFWYLFVSLSTITSIYFYILNVYKDIAFLFIGDDHFIAYIGSIGFIISGLSRIVVGKLMDLYEWKLLIVSLSGLEIFITVILYYIAPYKYIYGTLVCLLLFLCSPSYLMVWMESEKIYPNDKWVWTLINLSTIFNLSMVYFIENYISGPLGYQYSLFLVSSFLGIGTVLTIVKYDDYIPNKKITTAKEI